MTLSAEIVLFLDMLPHILFLSPARRENSELIRLNHRGQPSLWRYAISGDQPILLVQLDEENQIPLLHEAIKAHEYWRLMDVAVDLVIIVSEEHSYNSPLRDLVMGIVESYKRFDSILCPEDVVLLNRKDMTEEDLSLLIAAARVFLQGGKGSMGKQLESLDIRPLPEKTQFLRAAIEYPTAVAEEQELLYDNGLGGFRPDGREYILRLGKGNTPAPWINVIANPNFGFICSESGSGYTWSENSHEFRLTPWSNDAVSDPPGEVIYLSDRETGRVFTPTALPVRDGGDYGARHGFGYSVFTHECYGISQTLTQFVPVRDSVKISLLTVKNTTGSVRRLSAAYYVRPVLGVSDQTTAMHIQTSLSESGMLLMENAYTRTFQVESFYGLSIGTLGHGRPLRVLAAWAGSPDSCSEEPIRGARRRAGSCVRCVGISLEPTRAVDRVPAWRGGKPAAAQRFGSVNTAQKAHAALTCVVSYWNRSWASSVELRTPPCTSCKGCCLFLVISGASGANGFYQSEGQRVRVQLQDVLAVAATNPGLAKNRFCCTRSINLRKGMYSTGGMIRKATAYVRAFRTISSGCRM